MPPYDLESRLKDLQDRNIYAIARLVVFNDPILASQRPDLAVKDSEFWRSLDDLGWFCLGQFTRSGGLAIQYRYCDRSC